MDSTARSRDLWQQAAKILLLLSSLPKPVRVPVRERVRERLIAALGQLRALAIPDEIRQAIVGAVCHWEAQDAAHERLKRLEAGAQHPSKVEKVTGEIAEWVTGEYVRHRDESTCLLDHAGKWVKDQRG